MDDVLSRNDLAPGSPSNARFSTSRAGSMMTMMMILSLCSLANSQLMGLRPLVFGTEQIGTPRRRTTRTSPRHLTSNRVYCVSFDSSGDTTDRRLDA
jgi:hypothetical protein